jgi:predicted alpha-1,2-mannosidase
MSRRDIFIRLICLGLLSVGFLPAAGAQQKKEPVDYVDPNIGGIGQLLAPTYPLVYLPYSMMRIVPITTPGIKDRYLADKIYGFPGGGGMVMMPTSGPVETDPEKYASPYDHDLETATPYYYAVLLEKYNIEVEYTVSERAAFYRFAFPMNSPAHVLFSVHGDGDLQLAGSRVLSGWQESREGRVYFYAEFTDPCVSSHTWRGMQVPRQRNQKPELGPGIVADFQPEKGERIGVRLGNSYISIEQAQRNLTREIPSQDFERAKARAREVWSKALGQIAVKGGTEEQRAIFYTALYRSMEKPVNRAEEDRYYSPVDHQVHPAGGRGFYPSGGSLWGDYRSQHPLQLLLDPQRQVDFVRSFLSLYDESGRMMGTGRSSMIGHHVAALVLDTYAKGYRDFDVAKAYEGLKKNAMEVTMLPWHDGPLTSLDRVYLEKGFFPALAKGETESVKEVNAFERRQAVAVTLEAAYDDWCTAEMAKIVNQPDDYAYFLKRAHNYQNVFDARVGFMAPKTADGNWRFTPEEFNPTYAGGQGGRDYYTEMNAWIYTFHVQHDLAGLIKLMGGRENFAAKLDTLFTQQFSGYHGDPSRGVADGTKFFFLAWFPDMTGLIGQYAQGNEPSFHIPYLYNYAGEPWKTQRKVREIMKIWFTAGPLGIPGDDDQGEESAWYVLSAMGFYPVCPGRPIYDIGSPIFDETRITLGNGKVFTITAKNVSAQNKYIQSAALNGKPLNQPWFSHGDIVNGGTLVLQMGSRPNTAWGSSPGAAPPSMSRE